MSDAAGSPVTGSPRYRIAHLCASRCRRLRSTSASCLCRRSALSRSFASFRASISRTSLSVLCTWDAPGKRVRRRGSTPGELPSRRFAVLTKTVVEDVALRQPLLDLHELQRHAGADLRGYRGTDQAP